MISLIPTFIGPVLYDIYLNGKWYGSRRTVEQCFSYAKIIDTVLRTSSGTDRQ